MSFLPMVLLLLAQAPAPLAGTAVDQKGRPLAGIEIVLARGQAPDGTVPILGRATTDSHGRYQIAATTSGGRTTRRGATFLGAYRPGSGLVASVTLLKEADAGDFRLAFDAAGRRTFTLRGRDGQPLAGVRLVPLTVRPRQPGYGPVTLPDVLVDRMEAATGPDGRVELACLEATTELYVVRATIPGLGTHALALPDDRVKSEAVVLDLKPAGWITGRVLRNDGKPASGAEVDIWSRGSIASHQPVRFEAGSVRTGNDGTFRTPPGLLAGVKYRALVRAERFKPVLTEWVTPGGLADAAVKLADVVLVTPRSVVGRVVDRQGRPVAGAEVVAGGESAPAVTDEQGNFRLVGQAPSRSFLVVRRDGFRIDGRLLEAGEEKVEVVLARFEEPATRPMTTLGSPLPIEERRRLARRVLEPFLVKVLAKGEDSPKSWALRSLMVFDPAAALGALERTTFRKTEYYQSFLRRVLVRAMAGDDPEEAAAVAESIPEAYRRAEALVDVCLGMPDGQRAKKRQLIDRALLSARAEPEPKWKVWQLGEAAELMLDLGETDRAKAIFAEGRPIAERLGPDAVGVGYFASRLGRVDLPAALALLGGIDRSENHVRHIGNLAARIAATNPAEAERLVTKIRGSSGSLGVTERTCQNMARADLPRARRIALDQERGGFRAGALIFTAYGLPASERQAARDVIRQALAELDRASDPLDWSSSYISGYLPLLEAVDPALVPELFWRAVGNLAVADDPRLEYGRDDVLRQALLLARYDRQVASALFEPAARASAARGADAGGMVPNELLLLAVIDPRRAVAAVEAMPEPANLDTRGANWSRIILSDYLGRDDEKLWTHIWGTFSGLAGVLGRRDVL